MEATEERTAFTPGECGVLAASIRAVQDMREFAQSYGARRLTPEEEAVEADLLAKCERGCGG